MSTFFYQGNINIGQEILIDDPNETGHALKSLRKTVGNSVELIDGQGNRFFAEIKSVSKKDFTVEILSIKKTDTDYNEIKLSLGIAVLNKSSKMKFLAEKLTELGVEEMIPFVSHHTSFPGKSFGNLELSVITALKQCGGNKIMKIRDSIKIENLYAQDSFDGKFYCHMDGKKTGFDTLPSGHYLVVIGPEGGFTAEEREQLDKHGFEKIRLNKRILRAETAAIVAASKFLT